LMIGRWSAGHLIAAADTIPPVEKWANAGHDALQKRLEEMGLYQVSAGAVSAGAVSAGAETAPKGRKKTTKKRG